MIPALGFGTAPILGRISRRQGMAAMACAFEAGIRHFDTARSYGWGEAEEVLGAFLSHHDRANICLVSKCGIVPVRRSPLLRLAKWAGRALLNVAPQLRSTVRQIASTPGFQPTPTYDLHLLKQSFETSLQRLGTSYLDVLLLHNFKPGTPGLDDVVDWFRGLQKDGAIRRYGFALEGELLPGLEYLREKDLLGSVVQVPLSDALLALPSQYREVRFFVHSPFQYMRTQTAGYRLHDGLERLLRNLNAACHCEALICSMFRPEHVAENVAAWNRAGLDIMAKS